MAMPRPISPSTQAWGVFYASFGDELAALSLADPTTQLAVYLGNATNLAVGRGMIYFHDGVDINSAFPALVGLSLLHAYEEAPTDFAVDSHFAPTPPVPEPSTYVLMMIAVLALATLKSGHVWRMRNRLERFPFRLHRIQQRRDSWRILVG
jgi:PEP-CTERM motif